jgi:hypothetical protein
MGTYTLLSVDGNKVPCEVKHEDVTLMIKSGAFIFSERSNCISKMIFSVASSPDATREVKATYTREGPTLTLRWQGAGMTKGTLEGDTFTMNNEGMVFAFRKQ